MKKQLDQALLVRLVWLPSLGTRSTSRPYQTLRRQEESYHLNYVCSCQLSYIRSLLVLLEAEAFPAALTFELHPFRMEVRDKLWERWWPWGHKQSRELNLVIMFTPSWFGLAIGWQKDARPSSGSGKVSHRIDSNDLANHFSSPTMVYLRETVLSPYSIMNWAIAFRACRPPISLWLDLFDSLATAFGWTIDLMLGSKKLGKCSSSIRRKLRQAISTILFSYDIFFDSIW